MRNKFNFWKIHFKTKRMQFEFLKSDKRAKSYERLKFEKNRPKPVANRNSGCEIIRNSGSQPVYRMSAVWASKIVLTAIKRLVFTQSLYKLIFYTKKGVGWVFLSYIKHIQVVSRVLKVSFSSQHQKHTLSQICTYFYEVSLSNTLGFSIVSIFF